MASLRLLPGSSPGFSSSNNIYSSRTGVNNEQLKMSNNISSLFAQQIILVRRYITEYCPVLEGVYSRGLNVAGLEVTMLCNLIEIGTF